MTYRLSTSMLQISAQIRNDGDVTLPASVGLHPGFRWPLVPGTPKDRHLITFSGAGPAFYTRPIDRLIGADRFALSLEGPSLRLHEALFEPGGMAFLSLRSRSLCFHAEGAQEAIRLEFPDMDNLILWSRPGGDFLCIEPLLGHADLIGFAGDIMDKPCMAHIAPCDTLALSVTIRLEPSPGATLDRPQKA
jgi:galactose mutarotase-like enzyme